ncbi:hypothetical protein BV25DRAFT_165494 [Artomyces pyxidatus]|uniref:Uncharacterized protein n=1 Tax=Artomyces pyxidatus TaxID=48021 RepID=A0ACB8SGL2_9AGAM|nr:hypothetical protein BV25DRAFT_165494 [Artomyces pyxidatus]
MPARGNISPWARGRLLDVRRGAGWRGQRRRWAWTWVWVCADDTATRTGDSSYSVEDSKASEKCGVTGCRAGADQIAPPSQTRIGPRCKAPHRACVPPSTIYPAKLCLSRPPRPHPQASPPYTYHTHSRTPHQKSAKNGVHHPKPSDALKITRLRAHMDPHQPNAAVCFPAPRVSTRLWQGRATRPRDVDADDGPLQMRFGFGETQIHIRREARLARRTSCSSHSSHCHYQTHCTAQDVHGAQKQPRAQSRFDRTRRRRLRSHSLRSSRRLLS